MLAAKLNMTEDDAEKWVVNMIRNARLDAKIDSEKGHVVMGTLGVSPYQQVILLNASCGLVVGLAIAAYPK